MAPNDAAPVVLVGLPGSGKSTVGALVADRLSRHFVDLDAEMELSAGMSVGEIFARDGEAGFRRLERETTAALKGEPGLVIAPGGGWLMNTGARELLDTGAMVFYLKVSPARAIERLRESVVRRPLLVGSSPLSLMTDILEERASTYAGADFAVDTELLTPQQVAVEVIRLAQKSMPR